MWRRECLGVGAAALSFPMLAQAAKPGQQAPADAEIRSVEDRVLKISDLAGRPALIVYEDKDSASLNEQMKKDLERVVGEEKDLATVRVVAVADVSEYDFWPAKGAVKDAIREEQKKAKTTIWLDWTSAFRAKLSLAKSTSNFVLLDGKGKFVLVTSGKLSAEGRTAILNAMRRLVRGSN